MSIEYCAVTAPTGGVYPNPRRWQLVVAAAVLMAIAAYGLPPTADAQETTTPVRVPGDLSEGDWTGTGRAWGTSTQSAEGITFVFRGDYNATLAVTVDEQTATGTLDMDATWTLDGSGGGAQLHGDYYGTGAGSITGSRTDLDLDGTATGGGDVTVNAGGVSRTFTAQQPPQAIHIDATVTSATCSEAYLDWKTSWNVQIEEQGWQPTFNGTMVLILDVEELRDAVERWEAGARSDMFDDLDPLIRPPGLPSVILAIDAVMRGFARWAQAPREARWRQTADVVYDAGLVINRLRNASPCDQFLLGDGKIETYINMMTDVVARGIGDLQFVEEQAFGELSAQYVDGRYPPIGRFASTLTQLVNIGLANGVFGAGATDPDRAFRIEELLRRHAERLLTPWADADGGAIVNNIETRGVFAIAALMGWELSVRGGKYDPAQLVSDDPEADFTAAELPE